MANSARKHVAAERHEMSKPKPSREAQRQAPIKKINAKRKVVDSKTQRDQALDATFGLLKGKGVLPDHALQFERDLREELVTRNIKDFDMYASNVRVPYLAEITSSSKPPTVSLFTPVSELAVVITYVALPP